MFLLEPVFACGSMKFTSGEAFLLCAIFAVYCAGLVCAVLNTILLMLVKSSTGIMLVNLGCWAYYALPWLDHWLGSSRHPAGEISSSLALICLVTGPFVALVHFIFLFLAHRVQRQQTKSAD